MHMHLENPLILALEPIANLLLPEPFSHRPQGMRHILAKRTSSAETDKDLVRFLLQEIQRKQHRLQTIPQIQLALPRTTQQ